MTKRTPSTTGEFLRRDPAALTRLAASDRATWQAFASELFDAGACPPDLVLQLLAVDSLPGWSARIGRAFAGRNPDDGMSADFAFRAWLSAGIERGLPPTEPPVLELRLATALDDLTTRRAEQLVADFEQVGDSAQHRHLLGRALLLLARRAGEDRDDDRSATTAQRAEELFASLGDDLWRTQAVRARAAAMLRARRIDEALVLLDGVIDGPTTWLGGMHRIIPSSNPIEAALHDAARAACTASSRTAEWVRALGAVAERTGHAGCAARFESVRRSFADDAAEEPIPGPFR
jgi:hypothetical protein